MYVRFYVGLIEANTWVRRGCPSRNVAGWQPHHTAIGNGELAFTYRIITGFFGPLVIVAELERRRRTALVDERRGENSPTTVEESSRRRRWRRKLVDDSGGARKILRWRRTRFSPRQRRFCGDGHE